MELIIIISSKNSNTKEADIFVPFFSPSDVFIPIGQEVGAGPNTRVGVNDYLSSDDYGFFRQEQIQKTI